ncbi:metal ABC transporter ATP-binding protein [Pseudohoeflea coraliihabitans]|uniref:Metal ABC transporter ATP-binding protein n=1 Tax=Pseudohoeflea coraliihabitans TaxID=2860393 RepID=A0ABS6WN20_9HYPH|nr:metal ABC transporter ATP-binding protein [Pseudohoeflea sp. DP4N28-3]MBW3097068.1 metal ABC transporter ATP-binding protein [Pseudohoeflea sp. DP4N28-3]
MNPSSQENARPTSVLPEKDAPSGRASVSTRRTGAAGASASLRDEPLVDLRGVGFRGPDRWLVRGVDLAIAPGEIVTLIGPNGSGKSTTAKLALGILKPHAGTVHRRRRLKVSYVPQKIQIDWTLPLTVQRFMRLTTKLTDGEMRAALEATGIAHLRDAEVRNLSGGEFQRAMLARAIARKPDFLVLDEPVQGVDFAGEVALYELIRRIRDELGCAVLLISHDLHVVMAATDRVICLNGHVCCEGTPTAVVESRAYRQLFGNGTAALALYRHHHDHTHLPDGSVLDADGRLTDHAHGPDHDHDHDHAPTSAAAPEVKGGKPDA